MPETDVATEIVSRLSEEYPITYRCGVNLMGTINNMLQDGVSPERAEGYLEDILENILRDVK